MYLDISPCQTPDPVLFEELVLHKLGRSSGTNPAPHLISRHGDARCFIIQHITDTHLVAAHPDSGEKALISALQCMQEQNFSAKTQVILLSATPPPALAWLKQHHALTWHRCQVIQVNNDHGLLVDTLESPLFQSSSAPEPGRIQRAVHAPPDSETLPLTEEEHQFFSHL